MSTLRLAHRGDWRRAPENSLGAFRAALAIPGCDGLEFDVRTAADGTPMVIHDATLRRVQDRSRRVGATSAPILEALGVPTLDSVLAEAPRSAFLDIELKEDPGTAFDDVVAAARGDGLDGAVVSSFHPEILDRLAAARPEWPRWLNVRDLSSFTVGLAVELRCAGIAVLWRAITGTGIQRVAAAGLDLAAFTVHDPATYRRLEEAGLVAIVAEGPALDG
ncbi:MAG TPA: glycerophosphodiester phosphodiesterase [Candidatus Limnocylindrales bacterium]